MNNDIYRLTCAVLTFLSLYFSAKTYMAHHWLFAAIGVIGFLGWLEEVKK